MRSVLLLCVALVAAPGAARADEGEVPACVRTAVEAVQARYEGISDLSARFEQTTRSVAFGRAGSSQVTRGRVVFAKPGKMRWHYQEPEESLVVSDGHWLWLYDPARREAQKLEVGEEWLSGAAIQFLLGQGQLLRDFRVSADPCGAEEAHLVLIPRKPSTYEKLRMRADVASGDVLETEVHDLLGNVTRVVFAEIQVDTAPAPDLFRFEAPEGVSVIEMPAGR